MNDQNICLTYTCSVQSVDRKYHINWIIDPISADICAKMSKVVITIKWTTLFPLCVKQKFLLGYSFLIYHSSDVFHPNWSNFWGVIHEDVSNCHSVKWGIDHFYHFYLVFVHMFYSSQRNRRCQRTTAVIVFFVEIQPSVYQKEV